MRSATRSHSDHQGGTVLLTIAVQAGEIQATKYVPYSSFV
jgi:hypothetical protein